MVNEKSLFTPYGTIKILKIFKYFFYLEDLIVTPGESNADGERVDVTMHDHPLNLSPDSKWQTYFKDNEVLLQIDKDVRYNFNIL